MPSETFPNKCPKCDAPVELDHGYAAPIYACGRVGGDMGEGYNACDYAAKIKAERDELAAAQHVVLIEVGEYSMDVQELSDNAVALVVDYEEIGPDAMGDADTGTKLLERIDTMYDLVDHVTLRRLTDTVLAHQPKAVASPRLLDLLNDDAALTDAIVDGDEQRVQSILDDAMSS